MIRTLKRLFADHPREVGEGYLEHMVAAARFGFRLLRLSACAFTHALIPGLHKTTVSNTVCTMAEEMGYRAREARECRMREAGVWDPGL